MYDSKDLQDFSLKVLCPYIVIHKDLPGGSPVCISSETGTRKPGRLEGEDKNRLWQSVPKRKENMQSAEAYDKGSK